MKESNDGESAELGKDLPSSLEREFQEVKHECQKEPTELGADCLGLNSGGNVFCFYMVVSLKSKPMGRAC